MKFKYKDFEFEISSAVLISLFTSFDYSSLIEKLNKLFS